MSDYKLDDLGVTVKDAASTLATLLASGAPLSDVALTNNQIFATPPAVSGSGAFTVGKTTIGVDASASYQASVFRGATDSDPDGVVTAPPDGRAWLKQDLGLAASASGNAKGIPFGPVAASAGISAAINVHLLDYRPYPSGSPAGSTLAAAILGARFAFRDADVNLLDGNSRLALVAGGNLALSASITFADTLSASLAALDNVLKLSSQAGAITFKVGASLDLDASLSADFRLIFGRATNGNIAVAVHKAAGNKVAVTAELGVNVGFADPTKVASLLDVYLGQRLGVLYTDLEKLEQAVCGTAGAGTFAQMPVELQEIATLAAQKLGLADIQQDLDNLKSRLCGIGQKLQDAVSAAVKAQVKAQFTLSWSRVSADETVLAFEVDPVALHEHLAEIVFGNLAPVLKLLANPSNSDFKLMNYLDTRTVTTDLSFGFTLNLGKWSISSSTSFNLNQIDETHLDGTERISLDGRNGYTGKFVGSTVDYFVDLSAAMSVFRSHPSIDDFTLGLHLSWTWQEPPSSGLAQRWAELAEDWGLPAGLAKAVPTKGSGNADAAVDLVLSDAGVRALAAAAGDPNAWNDAWAWAMCAALPGIPGTDWRGTAEDREHIYGDAARWTLAQLAKKATFDAVAAVGRSRYNTEQRARLMPIDLGDPSVQFPSNAHLYSLAELWQPLSNTQNIQLYGQEISAGLALLAGSDAPVLAVRSALSNLHDAVNKDPFAMRIVGAAVVRLLRPVATSEGALFVVTARSQWNGSVVVATAAG